jgi:mRNA interferase YafQ
MRRIEHAAAFRRDFKRLKGSSGQKQTEKTLNSVIRSLASDSPLLSKHRDHALLGEWSGFRECHVKPDLLLVYRKSPGLLSFGAPWLSQRTLSVSAVVAG